MIFPSRADAKFSRSSDHRVVSIASSTRFSRAQRLTRREYHRRHYAARTSRVDSPLLTQPRRVPCSRPNESDVIGDRADFLRAHRAGSQSMSANFAPRRMYMSHYDDRERLRWGPEGKAGDASLPLSARLASFIRLLLHDRNCLAR